MSNPANPLEFYNFLREIDRNASVPNAYDRMFGPYSALFRAARMNKSIHDYAQRVDQYKTIEKLAQENEALRAQNNSGQSSANNSSANASSEKGKSGAAKSTSPFGGFVDISTGKVTPANNDRSNKFGGYIDSDGNVYDQDGNIVQKGNGKKTEEGGKKTEEDSDEYVTFTLPRANDPEYGGFAQKILDLGIATDKGLWGADGDVAFYTKQLYDQGALDANGNLKIGVPIRLRKRK